MEPGALRKRFAFVSPDTAQDTTGEARKTFTTEVCRRWGSIKPLSGRQLALAQANTITSTATHEIVIRFDTALRGKLDYQIRYGSTDPADKPNPPRYFTINAILDTEEAHRELRITVTEVVE